MAQWTVEQKITLLNTKDVLSRVTQDMIYLVLIQSSALMVNGMLKHQHVNVSYNSRVLQTTKTSVQIIF